jgi:ribosomal protein L11 methyltransferase
MSDSWRLTLPCTRAEAEALDADITPLALMEPPPSLVVRERDQVRPECWELAAYFEGKPDVASIALIQSLFPSSAGHEPLLQQLPDEDWLTVSQAGLEPVHAGRFYVHTSTHAEAPPRGKVPFVIDASQAFGTGGHETTHGCLEMLDRMKARGQRFEDIADIGTGTGLLAFVARYLWPRAAVTASDIDPISIEMTIGNAAANDVQLGRGRGEVALCIASGTDHELILTRAPYDLVIANILAGPLIELAPALSAVLRDGGSLILAGLLARQTDAVVAAYRAQGLRLAERKDRGEWPCLRLTKRSRFGWQRPIRATGRTSQPPGDFGSW